QSNATQVGGIFKLAINPGIALVENSFVNTCSGIGVSKGRPPVTANPPSRTVYSPTPVRLANEKKLYISSRTGIPSNASTAILAAVLVTVSEPKPTWA